MYKKGAYGNIHKNKNNITKTMELYDSEKKSNHLLDTNINECIFLSTFKDVPFITQITDITINSDKIILEQKYAGESLDVHSEKMTYPERIYLIEILMIQMARFLVWMKQIHVSHMDIKPQNMCIDNNNFLTFIDWGFVSPVHEFSPKYHGTIPYADQSYVINSKKCSYEYDMFGCALTLYHVISKSCIDFPSDKKWEFTNENLISHLELDLYKSIFIETGKIEIFELLLKMLDVNESTRITPMNLYTNKVFKDYWDKYPLYNMTYYTEPIVIDNLKYVEDINDIMIGIVINWFIELSDEIPITHLIGNAIKLIYRYLDICRDIKRKKLQLLACACLSIQLLINSSTFQYTCLVEMSDNCFTLYSLNEMIFKVLEELKYNVYQCRGYVLESKYPNDTKHLYIQKSSSPYIPSEFCFLPEDKKIGYYKKHIHMY
jgi:serine/threonine protein kinase